MEVGGQPVARRHPHELAIGAVQDDILAFLADPVRSDLPLPPREHGLVPVPLHPEVGAGMGNRMDPDRLAHVVDDQRSPRGHENETRSREPGRPRDCDERGLEVRPSPVGSGHRFGRFGRFGRLRRRPTAGQSGSAQGPGGTRQELTARVRRAQDHNQGTCYRLAEINQRVRTHVGPPRQCDGDTIDAHARPVVLPLCSAAAARLFGINAWVGRRRPPLDRDIVCCGGPEARGTLKLEPVPPGASSHESRLVLNKAVVWTRAR